MRPDFNSRREFLRAGLASAGTVALARSVPAAALAASPDYTGPKVILVRFGGGVRRRETIRPDSTYAPYLCHEFAKRGTLYPGFPFCLPRMAPLYTREPPIPRNFLRRTIVQLQRPSPQPPLTCNRLEPPTFRAFLRHRSTLVAFLRQAGFVALAARQPPGTGSAQILRSMSPNSRRVRCPSANRSQ